jgi:hypothetical protein
LFLRESSVREEHDLSVKTSRLSRWAILACLPSLLKSKVSANDFNFSAEECIIWMLDPMLLAYHKEGKKLILMLTT